MSIEGNGTRIRVLRERYIFCKKGNHCFRVWEGVAYNATEPQTLQLEAVQ